MKQCIRRMTASPHVHDIAPVTQGADILPAQGSSKPELAAEIYALASPMDGRLDPAIGSPGANSRTACCASVSSLNGRNHGKHQRKHSVPTSIALLSVVPNIQKSLYLTAGSPRHAGRPWASLFFWPMGKTTHCERPSSAAAAALLLPSDTAACKVPTASYGCCDPARVHFRDLE